MGQKSELLYRESTCEHFQKATVFPCEKPGTEKSRFYETRIHINTFPLPTCYRDSRQHINTSNTNEQRWLMEEVYITRDRNDWDQVV